MKIKMSGLSKAIPKKMEPERYFFILFFFDFHRIINGFFLLYIISQFCPLFFLGNWRNDLELTYFCFLFVRSLISGEEKTGFTIFWADEGLDTGPILLQRHTYVSKDDTVETLYNRFLFPEGIKAMVCSITINCCLAERFFTILLFNTRRKEIEMLIVIDNYHILGFGL